MVVEHPSRGRHLATQRSTTSTRGTATTHSHRLRTVTPPPAPPNHHTQALITPRDQLFFSVFSGEGRQAIDIAADFSGLKKLILFGHVVVQCRGHQRRELRTGW